VTEIRDLIVRVERELEKTFKLKLKQQLDQMQSVLDASDL